MSRFYRPSNWKRRFQCSFLSFNPFKDAYLHVRKALFGTNAVWYAIPPSVGITVLALMHLKHVRERKEKHPDYVIDGPLHVISCLFYSKRFIFMLLCLFDPFLEFGDV
jgi:hypothetical protein